MRSEERARRGGAGEREGAACDARCATRGVRRAVCDARRATRGVRRVACGAWRGTRSERGVRGGASNAQRDRLLLEMLGRPEEERFKRGASAVLHRRKELLVGLRRKERARRAERLIHENVQTKELMSNKRNEQTKE